MEYCNQGTCPSTEQAEDREGRGYVEVDRVREGIFSFSLKLTILLKAFFIKNASSSKAPALTVIDTSIGELLVEECREQEREEWRAGVERQRERQIWAKEIRRQRERDEEMSSYWIEDRRVNKDGTFHVSFISLSLISN